MEIDRYLSRTLFEADFRGSKALKSRYERKTAAELGFKEQWLQRAVTQDVGPLFICVPYAVSRALTTRAAQTKAKI
jgi:hypothetical protein